MADKIGRRTFFKKSAHVGISAAVGGSFLSPLMGRLRQVTGKDIPDVAVVHGEDAFKNTMRAVEMTGGIEKFVPKDSKVALLPNTQSAHPGTFTKPEILRGVIHLCQKAGAAEVNILSLLSEKNWEDSGLLPVIREEGAQLKLVDNKDESLFKAIPVPQGKALKEAMVMKEFYNNDVFITMPITKDHAGNKFTGTLKNMMGLNFRSSNRTFHQSGWQSDPDAIEHLDQCIADLNTVLKPHLCIVDAMEIITTKGPFGPGNLIKPQKIVAGMDRLAVDAYCASIWGLKAEDIIMINKGREHGLGCMDLNRLNIQEVDL
ncbi:MAG: DUF362 domain-containing protein [Candidatus Aminicenantes bacterium]|nr:DUF362 domain-containing protein [Candidatus Aminicenantes bacterium]